MFTFQFLNDKIHNYVSRFEGTRGERNQIFRTIDTTSSSYPTITICPCPYNHKVVDPIHLQMNFTVEDVMNLPSIKENTQALMVVSSTYMPGSE